MILESVKIILIFNWTTVAMEKGLHFLFMLMTYWLSVMTFMKLPISRRVWCRSSKWYLGEMVNFLGMELRLDDEIFHREVCQWCSEHFKFERSKHVSTPLVVNENINRFSITLSINLSLLSRFKHSQV